jgi:hypothetical protein
MNSLLKIIDNFPFSIISNDLAHPWQIGFQDGASPGFSGIIELHDTIFFYLVVIAIGVFWLLGSVIYTYGSEKSKIVHKYLNHGTIKCLSNLVNLELNKIIDNYLENRRILKLTLTKLILPKREILKPSILKIIRQYSTYSDKESFITPISEKSEDKLSQNDNILSEVNQSLDFLNPIKSYEDAYASKKEIYKDNKDKAGIYRFIIK